MGEGNYNFKVGEVVMVRQCIGLPAELPAGLVRGERFRVNELKMTKSNSPTETTYSIPPRLMIHLQDSPKDRFYDAAWFESQKPYFEEQEPFVCGCYFPDVQFKKDLLAGIREVSCVWHGDYEIFLEHGDFEESEVPVMGETERQNWREYYQNLERKEYLERVAAEKSKTDRLLSGKFK